MRLSQALSLMCRYKVAREIPSALAMAETLSPLACRARATAGLSSSVTEKPQVNWGLCWWDVHEFP
ncbi:hypothetical protein GCM10010240_32350 [Streptomyces griseoviridis]|nr:hypothetical protein GCM10010240_32350 [Streptomyces griseoviridis]